MSSPVIKNFDIKILLFPITILNTVDVPIFCNQLLPQFSLQVNSIGGIMGGVLTSSVVDHGFEPRSGQSKVHTIAICCFSANHRALCSNSKDWLARNENKVSEWKRHVYPRTVVSVSQHYENPTQRVGLEQSGPHHHLIEH